MPILRLLLLLLVAFAAQHSGEAAHGGVRSTVAAAALRIRDLDTHGTMPQPD